MFLNLIPHKKEVYLKINVQKQSITLSKLRYSKIENIFE